MAFTIFDLVSELKLSSQLKIAPKTCKLMELHYSSFLLRYAVIK